MRQGQRQRIRRIGRGQFGEIQHPLHHLGNGYFLRRAVADDGLLHFARGNLEYIHAIFRHRRERGAARLAHDDGGFQILREENSFEHANVRLILAQHLTERLENFGKAARMLPFFGAGNRPLCERDRICFFKADDAVAGAAQRRINAKNDLGDGAGREARGIGQGHRARFFAAEALLQLLELLPGNAHAKRLPAAARRQKQKRREVAIAA